MKVGSLIIFGAITGAEVSAALITGAEVSVALITGAEVSVALPCLEKKVLSTEALR